MRLVRQSAPGTFPYPCARQACGRGCVQASGRRCSSAGRSCSTRWLRWPSSGCCWPAACPCRPRRSPGAWSPRLALARRRSTLPPCSAARTLTLVLTLTLAVVPDVVPLATQGPAQPSCHHSDGCMGTATKLSAGELGLSRQGCTRCWRCRWSRRLQAGACWARTPRQRRPLAAAAGLRPRHASRCCHWPYPNLTAFLVLGRNSSPPPSTRGGRGPARETRM